MDLTDVCTVCALRGILRPENHGKEHNRTRGGGTYSSGTRDVELYGQTGSVQRSVLHVRRSWLNHQRSCIDSRRQREVSSNHYVASTHTDPVDILDRMEGIEA